MNYKKLSSNIYIVSNYQVNVEGNTCRCQCNLFCINGECKHVIFIQEELGIKFKKKKKPFFSLDREVEDFKKVYREYLGGWRGKS